jgi:hypothetical protein
MATKRNTKKKAAPKKMGRPTVRTPEIVEALLDHLEQGKHVPEFCREHGVSRRSISRWQAADPELSAQIARAREAGTEVLEEEYARVTSEPELVVNVGTEAEPKWVAVSDDVQHRKLKAHGLENRMKWNNVKRYGDKMQVGGAADLPPVQMSDAERVARARALIEQARKRKETNGTEEDEEADA